jgi:hypothetical protein
VTRRILLVLLAFTAVIIAGAIVPLALNAIAHARSSFTQETADAVDTDAAVVQARLDHPDVPYAPLVTVLEQVREAGEGLLILRSAGNAVQGAPLTDQGMPSSNWDQLATRADDWVWLPGQAHQPITESSRSWVAAAVPVYSATGPLVGTVILARSTAPLNRDILALWVILGTIGVVAMIAAALLAFALARWVSRPLAGLDSAAGRLADGDLAIRAVVGSGPPELRSTPWPGGSRPWSTGTGP